MRIAESELIINGDGTVFHLHIRPDQLADKIILVGDPERVSMFKPFFDAIECEGGSREFIWVTGRRNGTRITALSTGIGSDNIDIVLTELDALANIDFKTREEYPSHKTLSIIRIGTCGALCPEIPIGSFILSHYSIGLDGLLDWYADRESITDGEMENAFVKHMNWPETLQRPYVIKASERLTNLLSSFTVKGMTISAPGFYGPQGRSVRQRPVIDGLVDKLEDFRFADWKITNIEMESAPVAGMAAKLGHDAITVCCAVVHRHHKDADTEYIPKMRHLVETVMDKFSEI